MAASLRRASRGCGGESVSACLPYRPWYRDARIRGVVTAKNDDGTVEVKVSCVNQDEIDTCPGDATIALPTRDRPHPDFSDVPADWVGPRGQS
jgi:hypothetical protein